MLYVRFRRVSRSVWGKSQIRILFLSFFFYFVYASHSILEKNENRKCLLHNPLYLFENDSVKVEEEHALGLSDFSDHLPPPAVAVAAGCATSYISIPIFPFLPFPVLPSFKFDSSNQKEREGIFRWKTNGFFSGFLMFYSWTKSKDRINIVENNTAITMLDVGN